MGVFSITNRYASALLKQIEASNKFDRVSDDLQLIYNTLESSKELRVALKSPVVNKDKKNTILNELFGSKIDKESANFLNFVVKKNREDILFEIVQRYLELRDEKMNILPANVTTAFELSDSEKELFKKSLEDYSKKNVRITFEINPDLIGGFLVRLKDKMLDASVIQQLNILRKKLAKADQTLVN